MYLECQAKTALIYAIGRRSVKSIQILLNHGYDLTRPTTTGVLPADYALKVLEKSETEKEKEATRQIIRLFQTSPSCIQKQAPAFPTTKDRTREN